MLEFKFDTQLLIEGENLSEDDINDYFRAVSYTHLTLPTKA